MSKLYQNCEITIVSEGGDLTLANIKSALKRAKTTRIRTARNAVDKSMMKTAIRHFETALEEGSLELAKEKLNNVVKVVDKLASKGIIHKNTAARKKSRLTRKLNKAAS
jgi:small subunit ribosomal protein S20